MSLPMAGPGGRGVEEMSRGIRVSRPDIENIRAQRDRAKLVALAEGSYGGRYFEVDEIAAIPEAIKDLHEEVSIRSRPESLWDNGIVLTLLITLLCEEWALRKWNRLL